MRQVSGAEAPLNASHPAACESALFTHPFMLAGAEVRGTVAQQRQAARLAGHAAPSLLECAESVCSQAATECEQADQQEPFEPTQLSQLSQLNREDQEELRRLVALVRRIQDAVGREPLPQAVLHVLQVGWGAARWISCLWGPVGKWAQSCKRRQCNNAISAVQAA